MNKQWWLLILLGCTLKSYELKQIEQAAIDQAACSLKDFIERRERKQFVATCVAIAVGGTLTYRWWRSSSDVSVSHNESKNGEAELETKSTSTTSDTTPKQGWFKWAYQGIKDSCVSGIKGVPSLLVTTFVLSVAQNYFTSLLSAYNKFYVTFNWDWLLNNYLRLNEQFVQLKYCSAVLDPRSAQFSLLQNVTIHCNEQLVAVYASGEQQQLSSFDELIKLRLIAERRITLDKLDSISYEDLFVRQWNMIIDSLVYCLAFIKIRLEKVQDVEVFEQNQLISLRDDILSTTQRFSRNLSSLINSTKDSNRSCGLLAAVYEYANAIQHMCAILDRNSILE